MSAQEDGSQTAALAVVASVVVLVIAGVVGFAVLRGGKHAAPKVQTVEAPVTVDGRVQLYFGAGLAALPAGVNDALATLVERARAGGGSLVVSAYHDASGDALGNARLAAARAEQVRHALEANGVPRERLRVTRPTINLGVPRDGRRVDVALQ